MKEPHKIHKENNIEVSKRINFLQHTHLHPVNKQNYYPLPPVI